MAADTAVWQGEIIVGHARKIVRLNDGRLLAAAGDRALVEKCLDWLNGETAAPPSAVGECDFGALVLARDGIWRIDYRFNLYRSVGEFAVEGAHDEFLMGAMAAGSSAKDAVQFAIKYTRRAGGDAQAESL